MDRWKREREPMVVRCGLGLSIACLCVLASFAGRSFAGGYFVPYQTARAVGLSNAVIAGVTDPSAVFYNPAALSEVDGNQLMLTGTYINVVNSVENGGRTAINSHDDNFAGSLFGSYHLAGTDFSGGIGLYAPFGLVNSYHDRFTRFAARHSELKTYYLTPAIAWRPFPFVSLGAGISFVRASALLSRSFCFDPVFGCAFAGVEEKIRLKDSDNTYAYNVGILLKPAKTIKIGFGYRGRADLHFDKADTKLSGVAAVKTKADIRPLPLPAIIDAGLFWRPITAWGVELVYEYQQWRRFKDLTVKFAQPVFGIQSITLARKWKDTRTLRLGGFYRLNEDWEFRGGTSVGESPIPNKTLNPAIPGADFFALNGGVGYRWDSVLLDLGYQAVFYKTRKVSNAQLEGAPPPGFPFSGAPGKDKYKTFNNFISASVGYRF